ncbi:MAG: ATP-binding cassette domain-containing protein, partial [Chitinivibrionales bacterium]|nr:ATP-binding cassette domain-containing protein [Chitinivibrionales bacterium]
HYPLLLLGNVLVIICAVSDMAIIRAVKHLIDTSDWHAQPLWLLILPVTTACVANRLSGWGQWIATFYATNKAIEKLRVVFFSRLMSLSKGFFDQHKAGWLIARNTGDITHISQFMTFSLMMLLYFASGISFAIIEMVNVSPVLLLPTALIVPAVAIFSIWYKRTMSIAQRRAREQNSKLVANLSENVKGVRVVQAFSRQQHNMGKFRELNQLNKSMEMRVSRLNALFLPSIDFLGIINTAVVVAFAVLVSRNAVPFLPRVTITTGELVAYIAYMNFVVWPIRMLVEMYSMALAAMAAAERVFEIIDLEPDVKDAPDAKTFTISAGRIEFDEVRFRYAPDAPFIFENLNFTMPAGATIALVGETGAGKTTLANLVSRFYDIASGSIKIDGQDIRSVTQESLHQSMAIVLQEGYLFSGTVMDNLKFRSTHAGDEEIIDLSRRLGTYPALAALASGFATRVKEGGASLSKGQRQIVSLTRALAADPKILILDEPTSSLDIYTERIIQQALGELIKGRTSLIIAHRLSTIQHADQILVIGEGGILERGTHAELIERNGRYAELVSKNDQVGHVGA